MKLLVQSYFLRCVYLLVGGLPALFFSALCIMFGLDSRWTISRMSGTELAETIATLFAFVLAVVATASGWLAFFGIGISTGAGRKVHAICISCGSLAGFFIAWQTIEFRVIPLIAITLALVGLCLLCHLQRIPHYLCGNAKS